MTGRPAGRSPRHGPPPRSPRCCRSSSPEPEGPRITPFLAYQLERAWAFDAARQERFARVKTEADLLALQDELRRKVLGVIGGLPEAKTPLNARVTGTIPMDGYRIEKLVFESLPGIHVTALVYVPDAPAGRKPAVLARLRPLAGRQGPPRLPGDRGPPRAARVRRPLLGPRRPGRAQPVLGQGARAAAATTSCAASTPCSATSRRSPARASCATWSGTACGPSTTCSRATTWTRAGSRSRARAAAASRRSGSAPSTRASPRSCPPASRPRCPCGWPTASSRTPTATPSRTRPGLVSEGIDHAGPAPARLPAAAPRLGGRARLLPDRGHAPDDARGRGLLPRASATATASRSARATTSTSTRPRTRRRRSRSSTAPSAGPPRAGLGEAKTLAPEALRCTPSGQVREDLGGRSLRRGDPRRRPRARPPAARTIGELYRGAGYPGIRDWPVVAVRGRRAARRDRVGGGRDATASGPRSSTATGCTTAAGSCIPLVHVRRDGAPRGDVLLRLGLEGKIRPADWPEVEARLAEGHEVVSFDPRGLGETRMRYRAASIDDPDAGAGRRGGRLREPALRRPREPRLQRAAPRAAVPLRGDRGRRDRGPLRPRAARRAGGGDRRARRRAPPGPGGRPRPCPDVALVAARRPASRPSRGRRRSSRCRETWPIHYLVPGGASLRFDGPGGADAMRVLFLGGTGNISTACVEHALARGHHVGILTRGQRPSPSARGRGLRRGPRRRGPLSAGRRTGAGTRSWTSSPTRRRRWTRRSSAFAGRTGQYVFIGTAAAYDKPNARLPITEDAPLANPFWEYARLKIACEERVPAGAPRGARCRPRSCGPPTPTARPGSPRASAGRTTRWWTACAAACRSSATATAPRSGS